MWGNSMRFVQELGPPEYAAIIVFCVLSLAVLNRIWLKSLHPSERFKRSESKFVWREWGDPESVRNLPRIRATSKTLSEFNIPHPSLGESGEIWRVFLNRIEGEAMVGDLKAARGVWKEMQTERAQTQALIGKHLRSRGGTRR